MKLRGALVGAVLVLAAGCGPRTTGDESTSSSSSGGASTGGSSGVVGSSSRASSGGGSTSRPGSSSAGSGGSSAVSNASSAVSNASSSVSNASSAVSNASSGVSTGSSAAGTSTAGSSSVGGGSTSVGGGSTSVAGGSSSVGGGSTSVGGGSTSVGGGSTSVGGGSSSVGGGSSSVGGGSSSGGGGAVCGNGLVEGAETCDDQNTTGGDGCSALCAEELGWKCTGAPSTCTTTCGDGIIAGAEQCDDLGQTPGDGCDGMCLTEMGFNCTGEPSLCAAICGDGVILGTETCDDMGVISGDGCSSQCSLEAGFSCSTAVPTTCTPICGDGLVVTGELCDDQNAVDLDGCTACVTDMGFNCTGAPSTCTAICGDSLVLGAEECDDGNTINGDGCTACVVDRLTETESNDTVATANGPFAVNGPYVSAAINPAGDVDVFAFTVTGLADLHIETFDGTTLTCAGIDTVMEFLAPDGTTQLAGDDDGGIDACSLLDSASNPGVRQVAPGTYYVRVRAYSATQTIPAYTLRVSYNALCGNGVTEGAEECDGSPTCTPTCQRVPVCGDTFVDAPEQCDDGNTTSGDGCDSLCQREAVCGDGFRVGSEQCDDGNLNNGDGCTATCAVEPGHFFEVEANDTQATGNVIPGSGFAGNVVVHGGITPVGDADFFIFTLLAQSDVRLETFDGNPLLSTCAGVDTVIRLYDAAGTELANDDEDGIASCSLLSPAVDPQLRRMPAGTYAVRVEDYLNNGTIPGYQLVVTVVSVCGDGAQGGSEECDDGNATNADGCDNNCTFTACGNGIQTGTELCDDGNTVNGDGCDNNCTPTGCPNGIQTGTEQCDDGNAVAGDGCSPTCVLEVLCGNGLPNAGEQCDDGNTANGDGCSSTCVIEPGHFFETEPNDDGTVATGGAGISGNDFSAANANGPITASVIIHGGLNPVGDEDVFAVTNTQPGPVTMQLDVYNAALGLGAACASTIDTGLQVRDAAGVVLASNDDRNGGADRCSALSFPLAPGQTVYVQLVEYGDNAVIPAYLLQVVLPVCGNGMVETGEECDGGANCDAFCQRVPVCGDNFVDAPETCDDGNTASGDGCSSTCQVEGAQPEVEPNNTTADADANAVQINGDTMILGSITDVTDEKDYFRVTIAQAGTVVSFELFDNAAGSDCGATTATLRLFDSAGVQIATDNISGIRNCSSIVFPFEAVGTFYVQVEETGTNANIPTYTLRARYLAAGATEVEPNESLPTALPLTGTYLFVGGDHAVNADSDYFAITVGAGQSIRAELIEGNRGAETCEGLGVDSRLTLYNAAGTQLVDDDDDGRGYCSMIDGTGTLPLDAAAHNLAPGTYFLQVRASSFSQTGAAGQFAYRLVVNIR